MGLLRGRFYASGLPTPTVDIGTIFHDDYGKMKFMDGQYRAASEVNTTSTIVMKKIVDSSGVYVTGNHGASLDSANILFSGSTDTSGNSPELKRFNVLDYTLTNQTLTNQSNIKLHGERALVSLGSTTLFFDGHDSALNMHVRVNDSTWNHVAKPANLRFDDSPHGSHGESRIISGVTDTKFVFIGDETGLVYTLTPTWEAEKLDFDSDFLRHRTVLSLTQFGAESLLAFADNSIYVLDISAGTLIKRADFPGTVGAQTATIGGNTVLCGSSNSKNTIIYNHKLNAFQDGPQFEDIETGGTMVTNKVTNTAYYIGNSSGKIYSFTALSAAA